MDNKVQYLVEGISKDIVYYLMEDEDIDLASALSLFHNSTTFEKLINSKTGLYIKSSAYVYELLKSELKFGKL